jgi:hypothetical protein
MEDGRIVGGGSLFPNQEGAFVWLDSADLGAMLMVVSLIEERMADSDRREAVSVRGSTPQDWE